MGEEITQHIPFELASECGLKEEGDVSTEVAAGVGVLFGGGWGQVVGGIAKAEGEVALVANVGFVSSMAGRFFFGKAEENRSKFVGAGLARVFRGAI